ncbi:MAG: hypothetical protein MZV65_42175 [Chromatiales bacterium]|nr:hypothetical protein [Chromatiales bacterium]
MAPAVSAVRIETIKLAIDLEDCTPGRDPSDQGRPARSRAQRPRARRAPARSTCAFRPASPRDARSRLAGQGAPGRNGGPAGDLYLEIEFKPHRLFTPDGRDIQLRSPIAPWEAALGATVQVPTLGGSVNLKIPPGSQSGRKLRLKGRGLPGTPPGDEIVQLEIVIPPAETEAARDLYRRMAEQLRFDPRAQLGV